MPITATEPVSQQQAHEKKLPIESPEINEADLNEIAFSQQQLSQVKQSLGVIIDTMEQNKSLFSRAASFWGERPLWQKIIGGVVLTVPTLATGIAAHVGILLAISGVTVVAYTASGIVLDDHHLSNKNISEHLKEGIYSLADVLEITISALDKIRKNLAIEIDKFKSENQKLTDNIETLSERLDTLGNQLEVFIATEKLLRTTKEELEVTAQHLQQNVLVHDALLSANQKELLAVKNEHEKSQIQLTEKIVELNTVRVTMGLEIEKAKKIAVTLQGTVQTLSGTVIEDTNQRNAFQQKLDGFLADSEASFDKVADRISEAERELALVKVELQRSNKRYQELLERQENQVIRMERLDGYMTKERVKPIEKIGNLLNSQGFYALVNRPKCESPQEATWPGALERAY